VKGLKAAYFNNLEAAGKAVATKIVDQIDGNWTLYPPIPALTSDFYSVNWTGDFIAPSSGNIVLGLKGNDGYRLWIDNKLLIDRWTKESFHTDAIQYYFEKTSPTPSALNSKNPMAMRISNYFGSSPIRKEKIYKRQLPLQKI